MKALFTQIATDNSDRIYRICRSYAVLITDADDLFQEVMIQIWKSLPSFKHQSAISTWVFRIALNVCIRAKFSQDKRQSIFVKTDMASMEVPAPPPEENEQQYKELFHCIQQLNDLDRSIILLFLEQQSYKEISEVCGLTENHIAVRMKRIKQKLFTCLKPRL